MALWVEDTYEVSSFGAASLHELLPNTVIENEVFGCRLIVARLALLDSLEVGSHELVTQAPEPGIARKP